MCNGCIALEIDVFECPHGDATYDVALQIRELFSEPIDWEEDVPGLQRGLGFRVLKRLGFYSGLKCLRVISLGFRV